MAALDRYYAQASGIPEVVGEGVFENFLLTAVPALLRYDVRLYAADPADYQAALAAASAAGLPADQVTQSFSTAWDQTSSGEYLVIAVGGPADDALYYNVCGWTAPDGLGAGFDTVLLRGRAGRFAAADEHLRERGGPDRGRHGGAQRGPGLLRGARLVPARGQQPAARRRAGVRLRRDAGL